MQTRQVPFFNYKLFYEQDGKELTNIFNDVMQRGAYILQKDLQEFEENYAKYLNVKHAIGVANCTDGLIIALRAAGIKAGDEVILPTHTFIATAAAVHYVDATPVPVEVGADHLLDADVIEAAITDKTRAIMPVQLNGRTCEMDKITAIAKKHGLIIVEDAAQALGSKYKGQFAGTFGAAAAYSFYPAKILGCMGDGGMVVTNDDDIAEFIRLERDHGRNHEGQVVQWGVNSRLDNLHAAMLNYFFAKYDQIIAHRRHIAALYQQELAEVEELLLPPAPDANPDHFDVYQNYEIEADNRDALQQYLREHGVGTLIQWGGSTVHQFKALGFDQSLPKSEKMISRALMLPLNMSVTDEDVQYVCAQIKNAYHSGIAAATDRASASV